MRIKFILFILPIFLSSVLVRSQTNQELLPDDVLIIEHIVSDSSATKSILIGNVYKSEGEQFQAKEDIKWSNTINRISVINKRTWRTIEFRSDNFKSSSTSLYAAYIKKPRTGAKGSSKTEKVSFMKMFLSQDFYILNDEIMIYSSLIVDDQHTYYMKPLNQPNAKSFKLMYNNDEPNIIYIPISQILENNIDISHGCRFQITYQGGDENEFITNMFRLFKYNQ